MPLIRFQVRNEARLGDPELHRGASKDDPKAILDGVAVAGLVGILRQLGDLAEWVLLFSSIEVRSLNFSRLDSCFIIIIISIIIEIVSVWGETNRGSDFA